MEHRLASEFNITIDYPNWIVDDPSRIRNGICDKKESGYNTEQCGWDGGDCLWNNKYPNCTYNDYYFKPFIFGDGVCNSISNSEECGWDGGDCLEFNSKYPNCTVADPWKVGNGFCDSTFYQDINRTECGYDGGDCLVESSTDRSKELLSTLLIVGTVVSCLITVWDFLRKRQRDSISIQQEHIEDTQLNRHTLVLSNIVHKKVYSKDNANAICETFVKPIVSQRSSSRELQNVEEGGIVKDNIIVKSLGDGISEQHTSKNNPKDCPICCENLKNGDDIAWSKNEECVHAFHTDCIVPWLMDHSDCPMCRNDFLCLEESVV